MYNRAAAVRCRSPVHRLPPRRSNPLPLSTRAASNTIAGRCLSFYADASPLPTMHDVLVKRLKMKLVLLAAPHTRTMRRNPPRQCIVVDDTCCVVKVAPASTSYVHNKMSPHVEVCVDLYL